MHACVRACVCVCVCVRARAHSLRKSAAVFPSHSPFRFAIVLPLATPEISVKEVLCLSCFLTHWTYYARVSGQVKVQIIKAQTG